MLQQAILVPIQLYVFGILVVMLTVADNYLGKARLIPFAPTTTCLLFLLPLAVGIIVKDFVGTNSRAGSEVLKAYRANAAVIFLFGLLVLFSLLLSLLPGAYWEEGAKWIFLYLYGFVIFLMALLLPLLDFLRKRFSLFVLGAIIILLLSMGYDLLFPGFFSTVTARAAGFPGNSNFAALVMVMLCSAALHYDNKGHKLDLLVLALGGLGVFITLSRSGLLNFVFLALLYARYGYFSRRVPAKKVAVFIIGFFSLILFFSLAIPFLIENTEMFSNYRTRLSSLGTNQQMDDGSGESRKRAVLESLHLVNESPVLGHGTGYSRRMTELPHNIYLQQWINNGLPGVLSYTWLLACAFWMFHRRRFATGKAFILVAFLGGFFSHNILDQRPFLILLACLSTLSLYSSGTLKER